MTTTCPEIIKAKPFLKWAGGKSQLIPEIQSVLSLKFNNYNDPFTYIEPFIGGGSVLFHLFKTFPNLEKAIINDINTDLIVAYQTIKTYPQQLIDALQNIEKEYYGLNNIAKKNEFFLERRNQFNQKNRHNNIDNTVLLIFLNKTCFNGLYRVNSKGLFNVPFGKYIKPKICDAETIWSVHQCLQKTTILNGDFEQTLQYADQKTFFYLDPPYKPIKTTSSFTSYTKENFGDSDQLRLKGFCDKINETNCKFIQSNSDVRNYDEKNSFFDELYKKYNINRVKARRNINSKGAKRGKIDEILIHNF
ncbi:DNA adenine methylase [Spirulina sp. 06S082]|uniref:DNA adenine methylase n=1 Tax=Spirulina sp. 06S082 TaxID=3110248 RepID=UPI002B21092B|nr:DNA adenine methylase [Spirulina sp. 06S082]MEA5470521.1 DNA adenine methylase [Spirulina sp. 06S082]